MTESALKCIAIEGDARTREDAIRLCGAALEKAGYVGSSFAQSCVDREHEFPTGLPSDNPIAMPHCKSDDIKEGALCFLRLDSPVVFRRMDDPSQSVITATVINLAIKDAGDHLNVLTSIIGLLMDRQKSERLVSMDIDEVAGYLEDCIAEAGL